MAKNKTGFVYFNIDTDRYQDKRIKRLKKDLGPDGIAVYDYILCEIYRVKGYYLNWDDDICIDISDYWGMEEKRIKEIVNYCCSIGLFNQQIFDKKNVLTSYSIQGRCIEMSKKAKRNEFIIPEELRIFREESHILPEECQKLQEESQFFPEECLQSKVKESKVKKSKVLDTNVSVKTDVLPDEQKLLISEYSQVSKTRENIYQFLKKKPLFPEPFVDYWNLFARKYGMPAVSKINDKRKRKLKTRLADNDFDIAKILHTAKGSEKLLSGSWFTFDWLIENENNYVKVLEGNYSNKPGKTEDGQEISQASLELLNKLKNAGQQ